MTSATKISIDLDLTIVREAIHAKVEPAVASVLKKYDNKKLIAAELTRKRPKDMHSECWTCGNKNVRTLSMAEMMNVARNRVVNAHTFLRPGVAWGYLQCTTCEDGQAAALAAPRKEKWAKFDESVLKNEKSTNDCAPAFVQEIVQGLWSVQILRRPPPQRFGRMYRLFKDPPSTDPTQAYYDGWPGDHRGWMRFETKEAARDFYKFSTKLITFEEFQKLPRSPLSSVRIALDHNGDFTDKPV